MRFDIEGAANSALPRRSQNQISFFYNLCFLLDNYFIGATGRRDIFERIVLFLGVIFSTCVVTLLPFHQWRWATRGADPNFERSHPAKPQERSQDPQAAEWDYSLRPRLKVTRPNGKPEILFFIYLDTHPSKNAFSIEHCRGQATSIELSKYSLRRRRRCQYNGSGFSPASWFHSIRL